MKEISLAEIIPGSTFRTRAETEADLIDRTMRHVRNTYGPQMATSHMVDKIKAMIRDAETV